MIKLSYENKSIGKYYIDFMIECKIALEIKSIDFFKRDFTSQILGYLHAVDLKLGIIANFNGAKLLYKRYINPKFIRKN